MPKSKIVKGSLPVSSTTTNRTPVKINSSGTPLWYKIIMFGLMAAGLLWLIVNYLAGPKFRSCCSWDRGITVLGLACLLWACS